MQILQYKFVSIILNIARYFTKIELDLYPNLHNWSLDICFVFELFRSQGHITMKKTLDLTQYLHSIPIEDTVKILNFRPYPYNFFINKNKSEKL